MMVLPLLIIVLLPKVVNTNDPEMRKVMQNLGSHTCKHHKQISFFLYIALFMVFYVRLVFVFHAGNGAIHEYVEP